MLGQPVIRVVALPKDANADGDVFGGWILSMIDMAGAILARKRAKNRIVTVAIDNIQFLMPVFIGDCLECYARIEKIGTTSITIAIDTYVHRKEGDYHHKVTEGRIVYVAIDQDRKPIPIPREGTA